ncbi:class I histocompatibility antigen, Non-RT1.A alpha-1 chain-like [Hylobates moloch]|uniref:class I histocompatibility antigen, Non-RT1.A alpha-1 chain-like n=1 Tax=Hylobates moloch TaxID=81572 RepID=UPI002675B56A|nr:class I histocompatibility antigen, Non-RT1.A alpha-1 chain-like [Hylobates moloch]
MWGGQWQVHKATHRNNVQSSSLTDSGRLTDERSTQTQSFLQGHFQSAYHRGDFTSPIQDLQTWTAAQTAAQRMNRTWERFWIAEATREPLMGHCTRWRLRSLELGKETLLQAEPPSKLMLTIVGTIAGLALLPALVLGAVICKMFSATRAPAMQGHKLCYRLRDLSLYD